MTFDGLIAQAKRNKSALASPDAIEPASVSKLLRIARTVCCRTSITKPTRQPAPPLPHG